MGPKYVHACMVIDAMCVHGLYIHALKRHGGLNVSACIVDVSMCRQ